MSKGNDLLNQPQYIQHKPANYFKSAKLLAPIALIFFFLGILVCGLFCINFATKAMAKIIEGNTHAMNPFNPDYVQALQNYEEAQKLWPFLQYDHSFISEVSNIKMKLQRLSKEPSVIIYLKEEIGDTAIKKFTQSLSTIQGTKDVRYVSQEDALSRYREINKEDRLLLELVTSDLFPKSIEVYLTDPAVRNKVVDFSQSNTFVDHVYSRMPE